MLRYSALIYTNYFFTFLLLLRLPNFAIIAVFSIYSFLSPCTLYLPYIYSFYNIINCTFIMPFFKLASDTIKVDSLSTTLLAYNYIVYDLTT